MERMLADCSLLEGFMHLHSVVHVRNYSGMKFDMTMKCVHAH